MARFNLNGKPVTVDVDPATPILWALRDTLQLTGTKFGCGVAVCGACNVLLNGNPVRSCVTPVAAAEGQRLTTIEAVEGDRVGKALQAAWIRHDVPQCGYCQSGQIVSATALLKTRSGRTTPTSTPRWPATCACGTYARIRAAIHDAAKTLA